MSFKDRAAVRRLCRSLKLDGIVLNSGANLRAFAGFTGSNGYLLVKARGEDAFFTDGRYTTQAEEEVARAKVVEIKNLGPAMLSACRRAGIVKLGFEDAAVSHATFLRWQKELEGLELTPLGGKVSKLREQKSTGSVAGIRRAIRVAESAWEAMLPTIREGVREREIALELDYQMRSKGAESTAFETIVAFGPNSAKPHYHPGSRKLEAGDAVLIDFGARVNGWHSDQTVTFCFGKPNKKLKEIYKVVKRAHDTALRRIKPGVKSAVVDKSARGVIKRAGYEKYFSHGTGHGVGYEIHEGPSVSSSSEDTLAENMIITVEPGIYLPGVAGVRIEDMVQVTADGARVLTGIPKGFTVFKP